jgi:hypothetical protein
MFIGIPGATEARDCVGIPYRSGRVRALLAFLALDAGKVVSAERLIHGRSRATIRRRAAGRPTPRHGQPHPAAPGAAADWPSRTEDPDRFQT